MTTQELLDSLTAVHGEDAVTFDGQGYLDWSIKAEGTRLLEVGNYSEAVQLVLTPDDMRRLHTALTVTLLRDAQEG